MNLDELRSAQAKERRKDSLQHLRDSFYDDVAAYVEDLRAARDRRAEQVAKPFSDDDVRRMSDEVETAEEVAEALYERRVGKVVKLASFAAADMPVDADGMTTEERQLFDDLVDRITENKSRVLDVLSGDVSADETPHSSERPAADADSPARKTDDESHPEPEPVADEPTALTGAMGGSGDDVADALADAADESAPEAPAESAPEAPAESAPETSTKSAPETSTKSAPEPPEPPESPIEGGSTNPTPPEIDGDATTDGGPTSVSPDPVPPGAPGVTDADAATGDNPTEATSDVSSPPSEPASIDGADPDPSPSTPDRATVRITRDVGAIFGVDEREYDLASEDVVTLPVENAAPLVQRDAAERLD